VPVRTPPNVQLERPDVQEFISDLTVRKLLSTELSKNLQGIDSEDSLDLTRDKLGSVELARIGAKMACCGHRVEFYKTETETGLHNANFCRKGDICPNCAKRLQLNRVGRFREVLNKCEEHYPCTYLITTTLPADENLRSMLDCLQDSTRRLIRKGQKREGGFSGGEWRQVADEGAAIAAVEVKRGSGSGAWHAHCHMVVFTHSMIDFRAIHPVWKVGDRYFVSRYAARRERRELGVKLRFLAEGDFKVGKIQKEWIQATNGRACNLSVIPLTSDQFEKTSMEVFKYATKIFDVDKETGAIEGLSGPDLYTVAAATYFRRRFRTYGAFRDKESPFYAGTDSYDPQPIGDGKVQYFGTEWDLEKSCYKQAVPIPSPTEWQRIEKKRVFALHAQINGRYRTAKALLFLEKRSDFIAAGPPGLIELDQEITSLLMKRDEAHRQVRELRSLVFQTKLGDFRENVWKVRRKQFEIRKMMDIERDRWNEDFYRGVEIPDRPLI